MKKIGYVLSLVCALCVGPVANAQLTLTVFLSCASSTAFAAFGIFQLYSTAVVGWHTFKIGAGGYNLGTDIQCGACNASDAVDGSSTGT